MARTQGAKSLELRAAMSLARHWRTRGKQAEAAQLLAAAFANIKEGTGTADLAQAVVIDQCYRVTLPRPKATIARNSCVSFPWRI